MKFVRGFKQDCEQVVAALREELHLQVDEPIDMSGLALHLEIPVRPFAAYVEAAGAANDANVGEIYQKISAFTVFRNSHRTIVYNERHTPPRHRSNMAHELSHALLHHPALGSGLPASQEEIHEQEAAWMGGVLMLTRPQAMHLARAKLPWTEAMQRFEISQQMLRFRMNVTGAARLA